MIRTRAAILDDFDRIRLDAVHTTLVLETYKADSLRAYMSSRSIMTVEHDGKPALMLDGYPWKDGMYVWALIDVGIVKTKLSIVRMVKRWMRMLHYHTVYAHIKRGHEAGRRLASFLGFELLEANAYTHRGAAFDLYCKKGAK
jgi:hypothetical protein